MLHYINVPNQKKKKKKGFSWTKISLQIEMYTIDHIVFIFL